MEPIRAHGSRRRRLQRSADGDDGLGHPVFGLQSQVGNAAVARLVQRDNYGVDDKRDDPLVGQGRPVDPGDKSAGVTGTWDTNSPPKVTGGYADVPQVGSVDPKGDPLKNDGSGPTTTGAGPGPTKPEPSHAGPPGSTWDPILGGWRKEVDFGAAEPEPEKGDFPLPAEDEAVA